MSEENFIKATRRKLRFNGTASVEDLWDMPLTALDNVHRALRRNLREATQEEDSLLMPSTATAKANAELEIKIDVVRYVLTTRIAERDKAARAKERRAKAQEIMALLQAKEQQQRAARTPEELNEELRQLLAEDEE